MLDRVTVIILSQKAQLTSGDLRVRESLFDVLCDGA